MNYEEAMNFIQNTNKFGSVLGLDWKPTRPA